MMFYYRVPPTWTAIFLPAFLFLAMLTALGFGFWLSALNVRYRDINYLVPYLIQIWMYLTPVIYSVTLIPEDYQFLLALNPMTAVVEGFRWSLLSPYMNNVETPGIILLFSFLISIIVLISGAVFFRRTEKTFADVI